MGTSPGPRPRNFHSPLGPVQMPPSAPQSLPGPSRTPHTRSATLPAAEPVLGKGCPTSLRHPHLRALPLPGSPKHTAVTTPETETSGSCSKNLIRLLSTWRPQREHAHPWEPRATQSPRPRPLPNTHGALSPHTLPRALSRQPVTCVSVWVKGPGCTALQSGLGA